MSWVNNARLNGHSTFGYKILLWDHATKRKPKKITFLSRINDINREDLGDFDKAMLKGNYVTSSKSKNFLKMAANSSDFTNLIYNVLKGLGIKDKYILTERWSWISKIHYYSTIFTSIKKLENRISL
jgi:hypothetical protein